MKVLKMKTSKEKKPMNKNMKLFCKKKLKKPNTYTEIKWYNLFGPIVILLGPNGTGKSMSINLMKQELSKSDNLIVISYSTTQDDTVKKHTSPFDFRPEAFAAAFLSEGERMNNSLFTWMDDVMLPAILKERDKELYIFIDEADSGLSIDKINEAFRDLIFIVKEEVKRGRKIHVVITCNSYELAEIFKDEYEIVSYLWVPTNEYISLGSYNKFKKRYMEYYKEMNFDETGKRRN